MKVGDKFRHRGSGNIATVVDIQVLGVQVRYGDEDLGGFSNVWFKKEGFDEIFEEVPK